MTRAVFRDSTSEDGMSDKAENARDCGEDM